MTSAFYQNKYIITVVTKVVIFKPWILSTPNYEYPIQMSMILLVRNPRELGESWFLSEWFVTDPVHSEKVGFDRASQPQKNENSSISIVFFVTCEKWKKFSWNCNQTKQNAVHTELAQHGDCLSLSWWCIIIFA